MTIENKTFTDKIEILQNGIIAIRNATVISDGEKELAKTYERINLAPGDDTSNLDSLIQDISKLVWTPTIISEYQKLISKNKEGLEKKI